MLPSVRYRPLSDRARLQLTGPDRRRFLHGMVTNDVNRLEPGQGRHAAMLTVKGKMLADLCVYDCGDEGLLLEMEGAVREKIATALDRHLIMDDVTITDLTAQTGELGVYGPGAAAALGAALGVEAEALAPYHHHAAAGLRVARTPELGVPGFHVLGAPGEIAALQERLAAGGAAALPEDEAEVLRVEAGQPRYGLDMDEERLPVEAGLDDAVAFDKGCYLGQEVIARVTARGHVNRKLLGLRFPAGGPPPPRGAALSHESRPGTAGTVMTGVESTRHGTIALGYVHRTLWEPGTRLRVAAADGEPEGAEAIVCALPFSAA